MAAKTPKAKASGAENAGQLATKADATPAGGAGKTQSSSAAKADAKATAKKAAPKKVQQTQRGDQTPEAKRTPAEKTAATKKLFDNADHAAAVGLPPDITVEQHENIVRRAALGY